jgi:hypothetical protein
VIAICLLLCVAGALLYANFEFFWTANRGADFNQFRSAAILAGTGHLYDFERLAAVEREHHKRFVLFARLPFYALLFKPIAALPYAWGRLTWWIVNSLAIAGFVWLWPLTNRHWLAVALFWSLPIAILLNFGQDTALFLLFATGALFLLARRQDFAAGLALALCASKFNLALALPVFLAANRRWRSIAGAVVGGLAILAVSFAAEGPSWPHRLLELTRRPGFDPAAWRMPNIAGLIAGIPFAGALEILLGMAVLVAVWRISRAADLATGMATALAAGLLVSHHSLIYDCVLLIPATIVVLEGSAPSALRSWALILFTPFPYLFLLADWLSLAGRVLTVGFALFVIVWLATVYRGSSEAARAIDR